MAQYNAHYSTYAAMCSVLSIAAGLAVILRFVARKRTKLYVGADDWFAAFALASFLAYVGVLMRLAEIGLGYDITTLPVPVLQSYLKASYWLEILSAMPVAAGRFSILYLYNRLFNTHRVFRIAVVVVAVINTLWYIGCTLALILQCLPVQAAWNIIITDKKCINLTTFILAAEIPDSLLDFVIIGLPLNVLRSLQLPLRHKISLGCIFMMGGFVGVIGVIRISITYHPEAYDASATSIWLTIQMAFAVICCCLPTYRALLPKHALFVGLGTRLTSLLRMTRTSPATSAKSGHSDTRSRLHIGSGVGSRYNHYNNLSNGDVDKAILIEGTGEAHSASQFVAGRDFPMNAINVRSTVDMV